MRIFYFVLFATFGCSHVAAVESLIVVQSAWDGLSAVERANLQSRYLVDVRRTEEFGLIIDNQGIDESTQATNSGAIIGGALAQSTYIDRAFRGGSYSATTQLGLGLLGAIIGSGLDKGAVRQFHYRYALKLKNGDLVYRDSVQSTAFRHPSGMCLEMAQLAPAPQALCSQSTETLRREYLAAAAPPPQATAQSLPSVPVAVGASFSQPVTESVITCKVANLPPFTASLEKCNSIGGTLL